MENPRNFGQILTLTNRSMADGYFCELDGGGRAVGVKERWRAQGRLWTKALAAAEAKFGKTAKIRVGWPFAASVGNRTLPQITSRGNFASFLFLPVLPLCPCLVSCVSPGNEKGKKFTQSLREKKSIRILIRLMWENQKAFNFAFFNYSVSSALAFPKLLSTAPVANRCCCSCSCCWCSLHFIFHSLPLFYYYYFIRHKNQQWKWKIKKIHPRKGSFHPV